MFKKLCALGTLLGLSACNEFQVKESTRKLDSSIPVYSREGIDGIHIPGFREDSRKNGNDDLIPGRGPGIRDIGIDDIVNPATCDGLERLASTALSSLPALGGVAQIKKGETQVFNCPSGTTYMAGITEALRESCGVQSKGVCRVSKSLHPSNQSSDGHTLTDGRTAGYPNLWFACPLNSQNASNDHVRFRYVTDSGDTVSEGMTRLGLELNSTNNTNIQFYGVPALLANSNSVDDADRNFSFESGYVHICEDSGSDCLMDSADRVFTLRINQQSIAGRSSGLQQSNLQAKIIDQGTYSGCYVDFNETNSPLVLDVGEGIQLSDPRKRGVQFDLEGLGIKETISCLEMGAYLALPIAGQQINNIHQLFGNNTRGPDGRTASNGFEALTKHDLNKDGFIDSRDSVYHQLRLWKDSNCNGTAEATELSLLAASDLRSIDLDYVDSLQIDKYGNQTRERSVYEKMNGSLGLIVDIWLAPLQ